MLTHTGNIHRPQQPQDSTGFCIPTLPSGNWVALIFIQTCLPWKNGSTSFPLWDSQSNEARGRASARIAPREALEQTSTLLHSTTVPCARALLPLPNPMPIPPGITVEDTIYSGCGIHMCNCSSYHPVSFLVSFFHHSKGECNLKSEESKTASHQHVWAGLHVVDSHRVFWKGSQRAGTLVHL